MLKFMHIGGFNMWVLAALGLVLIWTAARFARAPTAPRLSVIRALTWALIFSTLTGFMTGLGATARHAVQYPLEEQHVAVLIGFAESTANLSLGGAIGFITWILVAVGLRRAPGEQP